MPQTLIIKKGGAAKPASPAPRKAGTKPAAAKKTTTRKTSAKPAAAKKGPATKTTRKKTAAKTTTARKPTGPRGPVGKQLSAADARKAASIKKRHDEITEKKDDLVGEIFEFVKEQRADGVSLTAIAEGLDMSRQWLYKMGDHQGRGGKIVGQRGGGGPATQRKTPAKSTAKKPAAKSTARKPAAKATTAKKTTTTKRTPRKTAAAGGAKKTIINKR